MEAGRLRDPSPGYLGMCRCRRRCDELCTASPHQGRSERLLLHYFYPPHSCSELGPGRKRGRGRKGGPQVSRPAAEALSPIGPCVRPGRSKSRVVPSQLAQASGKTGQVPQAELGSPIPIPRAQAGTTALRILPSSFPSIPDLQAVPPVVVAGDMRRGHPVPSTNSSGHVPDVLTRQVLLAGCNLHPHRSARDTSPCFQGQDVSRGPAPLPDAALCEAHLGLPRGTWGHGAAWGHCAHPIFWRAATAMALAPSPCPLCSWDLLSKSRKK